MSHIVTAPLVITKKEDGSDLYLYEGRAAGLRQSRTRSSVSSTLGMVDKVDGRSPRHVRRRRRVQLAGRGRHGLPFATLRTWRTGGGPSPTRDDGRRDARG
jgi:hypothetical protein